MQRPSDTPLKRLLALSLCAALIHGSALPAASAAAKAAAKPVVPAARVAAPASIPALGAAVAPGAAAAAGAKPLERSLAALAAPSAIDAASRAGGGADAARGAADADFAVRLGLNAGGSAAEPVLAAAARPRTALAAPVSSSRPTRAAPPGAHRRSAYFAANTAVAAFAAAGALFLGAFGLEAHDAVPALNLAHGLVAALSWTGLAAAATALVWAVKESADFAVAIARGKGVTEDAFNRRLRELAAEGRLDPGLIPLIRPYRPAARRWIPDMTFGFSSGGFIYVRPELIASPALFERVIVHEHRHVEDLRVRGPPQPGLRALWDRVKAEAGAYAAESAGSLGGLRVSVLDRALSQARLSMRHGQAYDVLVVNAAPELADPSIYRGVSRDKARVETLGTDAPLKALSEKAGLYRAVVLDKSGGLLPKAGTRHGKQLELALRQLETLHLLSERRMTVSDSGFEPGSSGLRSYNDLSQSIQSAASEKALEDVRRDIQQQWRAVATEKLKGSQVPGLIQGLYGRLQDKGLAFLPFKPGEPGAAVWQRLLRYWQAEDGGSFVTHRLDLEDGGHVLLLRKVEARVGLWLTPLEGKRVAASIPNAAASPESLAAARKALADAGYADQLEKFEKMGVVVEQVFGGNRAQHAFYVTVPKRYKTALGATVGPSAQNIQPGLTGYEPHMMDAPRLHGAPAMWRYAKGSGETIVLLDTGADVTHGDLAGAVQEIDMTGSGEGDPAGHGTLDMAIALARSAAFSGLAPAAQGLMLKVFGPEPGASDGVIMGALELGHQKNAGVISASLGIRGHSGAPLSEAASDVTQRPNPNGEYPLFVGSGGNSGPFDRTLSSPGNAREGFTIAAAAKSLDDGVPEVPFYQSSGPDYGEDFAVEWLFLKPDMAWLGGEVVTDEGDPNIFKRGIYAAKSKDMRPDYADTPDKRHTAMAGSSMAAPMAAAAAAQVRELLRVTGLSRALKPQDVPLALKAILMSTAKDMGVPGWYQGAGFGDLQAATELLLQAAGPGVRVKLARAAGAAWIAPEPRADVFDWILRYKAVRELDAQVRRTLAVAKDQAQARFDDGRPDDPEAPEARWEIGNAVAAEVQKRFAEEKAKALPAALEFLKDSNWLVRRQAAMLLLNLKAPEAAMALAEAALGDSEARVRQFAFLALAETRAPAVDVLLQKAVSDPRWDVAVYAAYALARHGSPAGMTRIAAELGSADKSARYTAAWLLGQLDRRAAPAHAELLSAKFADAAERANIRHMAASALTNYARENPDLLTDKVVADLLKGSGVQNLALTRTGARVFSTAMADKTFLERMRRDPLRAQAAEFVARNRSAASVSGGLGELVRLLANKLGLPLDSPTAVPDPAGRGVSGVDPLLGPLDLLVELPAGRGPAAYWDERQGLPDAVLAAAGLDAAQLAALETRARAALPGAGALWLSVPEHKLYALAIALERRGMNVRLPAARYSAATRPDDRAAAGGLVLDAAKDALPVVPAGVSGLVRLRAGAGASEARVAAALEAVRAAAKPAEAAVVVSLDAVAAEEHLRRGTLVGALAGRLVLEGVEVVAPAGNEGPREGSAVVEAGSLAAVVAAAAVDTGPQGYSARGRSGEAPISWTELVEELENLNGSQGTGEAAERSAAKLAVLNARAVEAFRAAGRPAPAGLALFVRAVVERALTPIAGRGPHEVGGGLFSDAGPALEARLASLDAVEAEAAALLEAARRARDEAVSAQGPASGVVWPAAAAMLQQAFSGPVADSAARWSQAAMTWIESFAEQVRGRR